MQAARRARDTQCRSDRQAGASCIDDVEYNERPVALPLSFRRRSFGVSVVLCGARRGLLQTSPLIDRLVRNDSCTYIHRQTSAVSDSFKTFP